MAQWSKIAQIWKKNVLSKCSQFSPLLKFQWWKYCCKCSLNKLLFFLYKFSFFAAAVAVCYCCWSFLCSFETHKIIMRSFFLTYSSIFSSSSSLSWARDTRNNNLIIADDMQYIDKKIIAKVGKKSIFKWANRVNSNRKKQRTRTTMVRKNGRTTFNCDIER